MTLTLYDPNAYNPVMLELAKDLRMMSGAELARQTGIPTRKIYQYLAGTTPSDEHLQALADVLRFPITFFTRPGELYPMHICGEDGCRVHDPKSGASAETPRDTVANLLPLIPDEALPALIAYLRETADYGENVTRF